MSVNTGAGRTETGTPSKDERKNISGGGELRSPQGGHWLLLSLSTVLRSTLGLGQGQGRESVLLCICAFGSDSLSSLASCLAIGY